MVLGRLIRYHTSKHRLLHASVVKHTSNLLVALSRARHLRSSRVPTQVNTILVYLNVLSIDHTQLNIQCFLTIANCSAMLMGSLPLIGLIGLKRKVLGITAGWSPMR